MNRRNFLALLGAGVAAAALPAVAKPVYTWTVDVAAAPGAAPLLNGQLGRFEGMTFVAIQDVVAYAKEREVRPDGFGDYVFFMPASVLAELRGTR